MGYDPWRIFNKNKKRDENKRDSKGSGTWKDVIVVTTSTAAFVMSAITTYLSSFRELDDVRVVVVNYPKMWHEPLDERVKVLANQEMTFSNDGNRSAAITAASLYINRNFPGGDGNVDCENGGTVSSAGYDLKPFTIAPKEIVVKRLHVVTPDASPDPDDGVELPLLNQSTPPDFNLRLSLCIMFAVVTPDAHYRVRKTLESRISFKNSDHFRYNLPRVGEARRSLFEQMRAGQWVLVQSSKSIFTPFWSSKPSSNARDEY